MYKQIDDLVIHLLPLDPPYQAIDNAITAITEYDGILQKRQQSLASTQSAWSERLARLISALTSRDPVRQDTDELPILKREKDSQEQA
jgi:hypothetical protein